MTPNVKSKTIELRRQYKLKLPDSIICATSIIGNLTLVSADKQLHKIKELKVITLDDFPYFLFFKPRYDFSSLFGRKPVKYGARPTSLLHTKHIKYDIIFKISQGIYDDS